MVSPTFRSRVRELAHKSRKALRLYTSMGRMRGSEQSELTEQQIGIWRDVNAELLRRLSSALEHDNARSLASEIFVIRDRFYHRWREVEAELHGKRRELLLCAENGDFVKASLVSRHLVGLKAELEACQAAHHELQEVLEKSKVNRPSEENSSYGDGQAGILQSSSQVDLGEFGLADSRAKSLSSLMDDEHLYSEAGFSETNYEESSGAKVIPLKRKRQ